MHWKRKDIWKKFFVNIICVVIWWNPAVYAVRKEVLNLIEFRCDRKLAMNLSDIDIVDYLVTLRSSFQRAHNPMIKTSLYTIEFVNTAKRHTISQRFDLLISIHKKQSPSSVITRYSYFDCFFVDGCIILFYFAAKV